jgi:hypothetical protein
MLLLVTLALPCLAWPSALVSIAQDRELSNQCCRSLTTRHRKGDAGESEVSPPLRKAATVGASGSPSSPRAAGSGACVLETLPLFSDGMVWQLSPVNCVECCSVARYLLFCSFLL